MVNIRFNVSIIKKEKGRYLARADELAIVAEPANTQRGAIKNLKQTVVAKATHSCPIWKLDRCPY